MTRENRTIIAPQDIEAVEISCSACQSKVVVPVATFGQPIMRCPQCAEQWIKVAGGPVFLALSNLVGYLKEVAEMESNPDLGLQFTVKLQLSADASDLASRAKD